MSTTDDSAASTAISLDQLVEGPIFVTGHARSGTTWVFDLLTSHPEVAGVLESWLFVRGFGFAGLFDQWTPDVLELGRRDRGQAVGLSQMVSRDELATELRAFVGGLLARRLEPQHRFLVEKSPMPYMEIGPAAEVFPDARFIHVVRDGRDVAVSLRAAGRSWFRPWAQFGAGGQLGRCRALHDAGRSWARTVGRLRRHGERLGERYMEIAYERLAADPADSLRRLFDFCAIPHNEAAVETALGATDFERHFSGGEDQFRRGGRVGDWRSRFGLADALAFELGSNGRLVVEGYESSRAWPARAGLPLVGRWPEAS